MNNQAFQDWSAVTAPWAEYHQLSQESAEQLTRLCISFFSDTTATAVKYMQALPHLTNPEDFINTQMKTLTQQTEKALEFTQDVFKICKESAKTNSKWTEEKVSSVMKSAAGKSSRRHQSDND